VNDTEALLAQLRDIQSPPVSMMPAAGWWILLSVLLLLAVVGMLYLKRYRRRAWHRDARMQLNELRSNLHQVPVSSTLSATSTLVRRVVLATRPRADVASLHGEPWLELLDSICGKPLFKDSYGSLLEAGPYQASPAIGHNDLNALMDVVDELIEAAVKDKSGHALQ